MVTYNRERTAYSRSTEYGDAWYLLPRGRKRAAILGYDGPYLRLGYKGYLAEYLTEEDRQVLLDADDEGVFKYVLGTVLEKLEERSSQEVARKRRVAEEIVDSYRRD